MFAKLLNIFSDSNDKVITRLQEKVDIINSLEESTQKLTNEELADKTEYFRNKISSDTPLDEILPEAFATV
ncbi:MAG TPA: hypothetical protein DCG42_10010, partial [Maribacter sp.]|nr:hypothetical protein [Maribacter sp.]